MKHSILLILGLMWGTRSLAVTYQYPVGTLPDGSGILLMRQTTGGKTTLFGYNPFTHNALPLLSSQFSPVGVQMLPSGAGFSFLDNGILKIKRFDRRSPQTIEPAVPLYNITLVHWISDTTCYLSARLRGHYGIFELDADGTVRSLIYDNAYDYLCPSHVGDKLFCLRRAKGCTQTLIACAYPRNSEVLDENMALEPSRLSYDFVACAEFNEHQIAFCAMISGDFGYLIGHESQIDSDEDSVKFWCYGLKKNKSGWESTHLFTFVIPLLLVIEGPHRLSESLFPLLPKIIHGSIYYSTWNPHNSSLSLYNYVIDSGEHEIIAQAQPGQFWFSPLWYQSLLMCGGLLETNDVMVCDLKSI